MRWWSVAALIPLLVLPACGAPPPRPRPPVRITLSGPHVQGDEIILGATRRSCAFCDDEAYVVLCVRIESAVRCRWAPVGTPEQPTSAARRAPAPPSSGRRTEARAAAAAEHDCDLGQVSVQSDGSRDGVEGYWLLVCGAQRFYQWDAAAEAFVDRTP
jgi:hypothetical protein